MSTGSCLCGAVRYEIRGDPALMYHCHCGTCRKANGSSFATNLIVPADDFVVTAGRERLTAFESSPAKHRFFCSACGSPIYSHAAATQHIVSVRCGTLDGDPGVRPAVHAYVATRAPWFEITDAIPQKPASFV
jgi:hypothetical protein